MLDEVLWDAQGPVPAIARDAATGEVLMFAWIFNRLESAGWQDVEPVLKDPTLIYRDKSQD